MKPLVNPNKVSRCMDCTEFVVELEWDSHAVRSMGDCMNICCYCNKRSMPTYCAISRHCPVSIGLIVALIISLHMQFIVGFGRKAVHIANV